MERRRMGVVAALGVAQTLAWASSYYLIAILANPMARELRVSSTSIFAAFSAALLVSAAIGPRVGRTIDAFGGRGVLAASNLMFAAGLALLGLAQTEVALWLGWLVLGVAMGAGLYDAAFAALGRLYGSGARSAITGITLIAGFASTVGWPLTAWGVDALGWRNTCFAWGLAHLVIGLPLNLIMLPQVPPRAVWADGAPAAVTPVVFDRTMCLLAYAFAAGWVVATAMAAHLPRIIEAAGATPAQAVAAAALLGPAQVAARFFDAAAMGRYHPLFSARLCMFGHPIGAAVLWLGGAAFPMVFTVLHGLGHGILTIARGTVPLAIFGPEGYGHRLGLLGAPMRIAQAAAPVVFGILLDRLGADVLWVSSVICLSAIVAFAWVPAAARRKDAGG
jgi:predicted MFS family arabinose efflux permease